MKLSKKKKKSGNSVNSKREIHTILTRSPCLGEDGDPPIERDVCIYEKTFDKPIRIPNISKHVDLMVYSLIFLFSGSGWSPVED